MVSSYITLLFYCCLQDMIILLVTKPMLSLGAFQNFIEIHLVNAYLSPTFYIIDWPSYKLANYLQIVLDLLRKRHKN